MLITDEKKPAQNLKKRYTSLSSAAVCGVALTTVTFLRLGVPLQAAMLEPPRAFNGRGTHGENYAAITERKTRNT